MAMSRKKKGIMKRTRKKGGSFSNVSKHLSHLPLLVGIQHCIQSESIDEKYLVDQVTRERTEPGYLQFILACHGGNPGSKSGNNESKPKRRKKNSSGYDDPTFETSLLNIFRFGESDANAESSVVCSENVNDYRKIMDKIDTGLFSSFVFETELNRKPHIKKQLGIPKTRKFTNFLLSNWNETIDETAGLYLYEKSIKNTNGTLLEQSRLIPILMFNKEGRHTMDLHQVSMFIELYFGDSLLYTVMCRDYIGTDEERRKLQHPPIILRDLLDSSHAHGPKDNDL